MYLRPRLRRCNSSLREPKRWPGRYREQLDQLFGLAATEDSHELDAVIVKQRAALINVDKLSVLVHHYARQRRETG